MKQELNIAAILKDKPEDTSLWSPIFGNVLFTCVNNTERDSRISIVVRHNGYTEEGFFCDGRFDKDGECLLFPSKEMRDWSKFAWKKGDVLKGIKGITCIFDSFKGEDYLDFCAWYYYDPEDEDWEYNTTTLSTLCFKKVDESDRANYIKKIEGHYGGKLNLETLEIEKPEPQFKDGDIVADGTGISICRNMYKHTIYFYASIDKNFGLMLNSSSVAKSYRLATDSEKQQLFDALAKENKVWNAKKKAIVDLPKHKRAIWRYRKKHEFELKDFCLMRRGSIDTWHLCQYSDTCADGYYAVGGNFFKECIPYNEKTAHLLGTTDEWKGGEG